MSVQERPFGVRRDRRETGVGIVASGEIDLWSAPEVKAALADQGSRECPVVLDLREVTFMDSSGLGLIVESNQRARKHGFRFAVAVGGATDVHRILEMSGLTKVLAFVDDPDAFLAGGEAWRAGVRSSPASATFSWRADRSGATRTPSIGRRTRSASPSSGRAVCRPSSR